jgi:prophage maintenance system killer protein
LVLPIGKNFSREAFEHFAHVLMLSLLVQNHCFALPKSENGNKRSSMMS